MGSNYNINPFMGSTMALLFTFSTLWALVFYYYQGANTPLQVEGIPQDANSIDEVNLDNSGVFGFVISVGSGVLEALSWLSPFALVKALLLFIMSETPEFYQIINLLLLRPIGWIMLLFEVNYIIAKTPLSSGE